jgi:hypothetical protein
MLKLPKEFDSGFQITFNSEYGKCDLILDFMEFLGAYELAIGETCFSPMLRKVYAAMKAGAVMEEVDDE